MSDASPKLSVFQSIVVFVGSLVATGLFVVIWLASLGWLTGEFKFMDSPVGSALYVAGVVFSLLFLRKVSRGIRNKLVSPSTTVPQ